MILIRIGICLLAAFAVFAHGAVEPWSEAALEIGAALLLAWWRFEARIDGCIDRDRVTGRRVLRTTLRVSACPDEKERHEHTSQHPAILQLLHEQMLESYPIAVIFNATESSPMPRYCAQQRGSIMTLRRSSGFALPENSIRKARAKICCM